MSTTRLHRVLLPSLTPTTSTSPSIPPPVSIHHPLHSFLHTASYLLPYLTRDITPSCSLNESHNSSISLMIPLLPSLVPSNTLIQPLPQFNSASSDVVFSSWRTRLNPDTRHFNAFDTLLFNGLFDHNTAVSVLVLWCHGVRPPLFPPFSQLHSLLNITAYIKWILSSVYTTPSQQTATNTRQEYLYIVCSTRPEGLARR